MIGTAYLTFGVARVNWFQKYITASMGLTDAANLVPRSPILLSGLRVGEVTEVKNSANGVRVDFRVRSEYQIPVASTVTIEYLSALGEPYLEFQPQRAGAPYLEDGQQVSADSIQMPISIPEMADTVTRMLEQFDPQAINSLVTTFSQSMQGTEAVMPDLIRASNLLAATLFSRAPQITTLLQNAQVPGPDVAKAGAQLAEAGPKWGEFGVKVRDVVKSLETLMEARPVPEAYTTGTGVLQFLPKLTDYVRTIGPDLAGYYPVLGPLLTQASGALPGIDLSALIAQALQSVKPDGGIRLQIQVK
ncbi:MlaD family protein [Nocardia cyriacigeorgica]|uniref:MlaD family protein n=1 Tax=Nocardia cyriacigeorgica TaxID=135487 RepID=UPI0020178019|nr:MlaD family protein [Nocardia cyriacigeorgica]